MSRFILLFFLPTLMFCFPIEARESLITNPPKGWECINDPLQLPQKVKLIYVGKASGTSAFTPSINIACEPTSLPLQEYVKAAKGYHEGSGEGRCLELGLIQTAAGSAQLLQLDKNTQWGMMRFLQAMLICNGEAYVVTATCLKNEFSLYSSQIVKAIQSFKIIDAVH